MLLTVMACGGESPADRLAREADRLRQRSENLAKQKTIEVEANAYKPAKLTVAPDTTVVWRNLDKTSHSVTSDDAFTALLLSEGDSFGFTFTTPGTYRYHCEIHGADVMSAVVQVRQE